MTSEDTPAPSPADDGIRIIGGRRFMQDAKGRLVPEDLVADTDKLEDQAVRKIIGYGRALSAQIARFKGHTFDDINTLIDILAEKYGASKGGRKGNMTLTTYDGLGKVQVAVTDLLSFGPELQVAKQLVDECIESWAEGSNENIRALVEHAFDIDKEGKINRSALFQLRRVKIDDERWQRAMDAISDAVRTIGSREYVRLYERDSISAPWRPITIDLAAA